MPDLVDFEVLSVHLVEPTQRQLEETLDVQ